MSSFPARVDVHNHIVPKIYAETLQKLGGDPSGWSTPSWSEEEALIAMDKLGVKIALLSLTAPGCTILKGQEGRDFARKINENCAEVVKAHPSRFGLFAALPSLTDTEGSLAEIAYCLDVLKADGITLFTSYEGQYLGNEIFNPIWKELNKRKAVVFVHPTHSETSKAVSKFMHDPLIDYPHETSRTATDLVLSNTIRQCPDVKVILSHAGGTVPFLIERIAVIAMVPALECPKTSEEIKEDFRRFYFDTALSASPSALKALLEVADHSRILFGSDFPYAPLGCGMHFAENLDRFKFEEGQLEKINNQNAIALIPRLAEIIKK